MLALAVTALCASLRMMAGSSQPSKKPRHPAGLPMIKSQWAGFGIVQETVPRISQEDKENPFASAWDL